MRIRVGVIALVALLSCPGLAAAQASAMGVFDLTVTKSDVIKPGATRIVAASAYVRLAHGLMPGKSDGLEVMFFTTPPDEASRADVLKNDGRELRKRSYAALMLFLDKQNKVWQVNVSYVVPGATVARTVAWKRDDIEKYFSDVQFDGRQLVFKSKGSYSESEPGPETLQLSWSVNVNLPVIGEVGR